MHTRTPTLRLLGPSDAYSRTRSGSYRRPVLSIPFTTDKQHVLSARTPDSGAATTKRQIGTLNCGDCPRRRASFNTRLFDRLPARRTVFEHLRTRQRTPSCDLRSFTGEMSYYDAIRNIDPPG